MATGRVAHCLVVVHGKETPTDEEWNAFLAIGLKYVAANPMRLLVVTDGGAPSAKQRKRVAEVLVSRPETDRIAIVTASMIARGVVTALSWFNPVQKTFAPNHLDDALEYLQFPHARAGEMKQLLAQLQGELLVKRAG
jgi:hypothetical protein